jgi:lipid-A-disaccharide synthase
LGAQFWWLSLVGDLMTLAYFTQIYDPVNIVGPALGLIPYIRNLMLLRQSSVKPQKI